MSEVLSNIVEPVVDCFEGGLEIISQEEMLAKIDIINEKNKDWTPGTWWDGYQEDEFETCGLCQGDENVDFDQDSPELCTCYREMPSSETNLLPPPNMPDRAVPQSEVLPNLMPAEPQPTPDDLPQPSTDGKAVPNPNTARKKCRVTIKFMKQRRRRKWERDYSWLENDLERLISSQEANPEDLQDYSLPMVIIGSDVEALYPNLCSERVAKLVYEAIIKSKVKFENNDYLEAVRFIAMSWLAEECRRSHLRRILPVRRSNKGTRPGMRGAGPMGPERGDTEMWKFPDIDLLTEKEKRDVIATVVQISIKQMFSSHIYTFGGSYYRQKSGGPMGLRSTCAVARCAMLCWDAKWLEILSSLKIIIEEAIRYMDDARAWLHPFMSGWRWKNGGLWYCKRWELEDMEINPLERTKRILQGIMDNIEGFLKFTMETGQDFPDAWLPMLDTSLRMSVNNIVMYRFFEKPMGPNICLQMRTAMGEDKKMRCLANDLIRRPRKV
jgi:hypothetical protein